MRRAGLGGAAAFWLLVGTEVHAQTAWHLDLSGGATRHQTTRVTPAFTVAPELYWWSSWARVQAGFAYTAGSALGWNAEGGFAGMVTHRFGQRVAVELESDGRWTAARWGESSSEITLMPAVHLNLPFGDFTAEVGGGRAAVRDQSQQFGILGVRSRWRVGRLTVSGNFRYTQLTRAAIRLGESWIPEDPIPSDTPLPRDSLLQAMLVATPNADSGVRLKNYSDAGVNLDWASGRTRLQLAVQQRFGPSQLQVTGWHLGVERAVDDRFTLFATTGRTLSVLTVGLPARRYTVLGMRWAPGVRHPPRAGNPPGVLASGPRIERLNDQEARVSIHVGSARVVEVMGDLSDWQPMALEPLKNGWWALPRSLAPGLYRLNVRVNGGTWQIPEGLPTEADDFNGRVGLLLIPR